MHLLLMLKVSFGPREQLTVDSGCGNITVWLSLGNCFKVRHKKCILPTQNVFSSASGSFWPFGLQVD